MSEYMLEQVKEIAAINRMKDGVIMRKALNAGTAARQGGGTPINLTGDLPETVAAYAASIVGHALKRFDVPAGADVHIEPATVDDPSARHRPPHARPRSARGPRRARRQRQAPANAGSRRRSLWTGSTRIPGTAEAQIPCPAGCTATPLAETARHRTLRLIVPWDHAPAAVEHMQTTATTTLEGFLPVLHGPGPGGAAPPRRRGRRTAAPSAAAASAPPPCGTLTIATPGWHNIHIAEPR